MSETKEDPIGFAVLPRFVAPDFKNNWSKSLTFDQYLTANEFMPASALKTILRSPLHFYHRYGLGNEPETTEAQRIGQLVHAAILEPERFQKNMKIMPNFDKRTKIGKAQHEDWLNHRTPEDITISNEHYDLVLRVIEQVHQHPVARGVLLGGDREWSGFYRDPTTGLACKFRPDLMVREEGMVLDVKTTRDARKYACQKQISEFGYDISAAHYLVGASEIDTEIKWTQYFFLFVEKTAPYAAALYLLDNAGIETGMVRRRKAIQVYGQCVKANTWPGYQEAAEYISVPDFLFNQTEQDMENQSQEDEEKAV